MTAADVVSARGRPQTRRFTLREYTFSRLAERRPQFVLISASTKLRPKLGPKWAVLFDIQTVLGYFIGMPNSEQPKREVLQGTLDLMVLQTLVSLGPSHGYAIAARLEQVSNRALQVNMGTLYPALMRMEQRGLVSGAWRTTDSNRRARFYSVTPAGRRQLARKVAA